VSDQPPLHPDDRLERALGDMRQSVAARGEEGWVDRVLMAGIWLALLSILDTLIELLADFRAGRLPPVLAAELEPGRGVGHPPTVASRDSRSLRGRVASVRRAAPSDAGLRSWADGAPDDAPVPAAAQWADRTPRRLAFTLPPPRRPVHRPEPAPRRIPGYPPVVPRWPAASLAGSDTPPTHAQFVAISYRYS
jgi:hypothetical protein